MQVVVLSFICIGTDLNSLLECNKYEIFAMLLPEYIALSDVFDRNTDNSSEDSDDGKDIRLVYNFVN